VTCRLRRRGRPTPATCRARPQTAPAARTLPLLEGAATCRPRPPAAGRRFALTSAKTELAVAQRHLDRLGEQMTAAADALYEVVTAAENAMHATGNGHGT